jgi:hypothetical protein
LGGLISCLADGIVYWLRKKEKKTGHVPNRKMGGKTDIMLKENYYQG